MPSEVHEHFDADGTLTGTTVVTRESAWDEESRERALALQVYEAGICGCGCNQPVGEAYDPKQPYKVSSFTCNAGRAIAIVRKRDEDEAKRAKKPEGWNAGLHYYAEPVKGGDDG